MNRFENKKKMNKFEKQQETARQVLAMIETCSHKAVPHDSGVVFLYLNREDLRQGMKGQQYCVVGKGCAFTIRQIDRLRGKTCYCILSNDLLEYLATSCLMM